MPGCSNFWMNPGSTLFLCPLMDFLDWPGYYESFSLRRKFDLQTLFPQRWAKPQKINFGRSLVYFSSHYLPIFTNLHYLVWLPWDLRNRCLNLALCFPCNFWKNWIRLGSLSWKAVIFVYHTDIADSFPFPINNRKRVNSPVLPFLFYLPSLVSWWLAGHRQLGICRRCVVTAVKCYEKPSFWCSLSCYISIACAMYRYYCFVSMF